MNTISCFEPKFSGEYQIVLIRPSKSLNYSKRQNKLQTNTLKCSEFSCTSCLLIMHDDYIKSVKTKIDYEWSLFRLFRRARIKRKKPAREKWLHEIHFFRRFFFRVVLDGLRERGTTRSLKLRCQLASVLRLNTLGNFVKMCAQSTGNLNRVFCRLYVYIYRYWHASFTMKKRNKFNNLQ